MLTASFASCLLFVAACEQGPGNASTSGGDHAARSTEKPSAWLWPEASPLVAIADEDHDEELTAAVAEAQRTAEGARERWVLAVPADRSNWAIKWAAPTADGKVEHLWVRPLSWSPFRVEGRLANDPLAPLACGKALGDLVSFPIDELTDWMYLEQGTITGPRDGGYTVEVLVRRYGIAEPDSAP